MIANWISAFRLRTLPLAVSSILVGSALAWFTGGFRSLVLVASLSTALLLQILSNLANDLGDHVHGTDNGERIGPQRSVQSGAISPTLMKRALFVCGALSFISGSWLIVVALGFTWTAVGFLLLGLLAIGAAVKYTYGNDPYGYAGLGDLSVFLFFGIVGVLGTYYLHVQRLAPTVLFPAIGFGLLSAGVLNVNNMRDMQNDAASGKRTVVVKLGMAKAKSYHGLLVLGGLMSLIVFTALEFRGMAQWGFLVTTPALGTHLRSVLSNHDPAGLDPQLKRLALGTFFTALTFSIGLCIV